MIELQQTLADLATKLSELGIPYMLIGGMANAIWGEPRATLDIDVTIEVDESRKDSVIDALCGCYDALVDSPQEFVGTTRVLPLRASSGVRIDLIFSLLPFEQEAIQRAVEIEIGGASVSVCTAEDLILLKIFSDRERDINDAHAVCLRQFKQLDLDYLEPRIDELSKLLNRPELMQQWREWKKEAGRT